MISVIDKGYDLIKKKPIMAVPVLGLPIVILGILGVIKIPDFLDKSAERDLEREKIEQQAKDIELYDKLYADTHSGNVKDLARENKVWEAKCLSEECPSVLFEGCQYNRGATICGFKIQDGIAIIKGSDEGSVRAAVGRLQPYYIERAKN